MDRLPMDSVELGNFTLNWDDFVRDTVLLLKVENLNRALWLSLDEVVVLDGKVFTHGVHEHLEESRSSEGSKTKVGTLRNLHECDLRISSGVLIVVRLGCCNQNVTSGTPLPVNNVNSSDRFTNSVLL